MSDERDTSFRSRITNRISSFVQERGYSYRSFLVGVVIFPPAAMLIAWKIPGISTATRITLTAVAVVVPPALLYLGGLVVVGLFG